MGEKGEEKEGSGAFSGHEDVVNLGHQICKSIRHMRSCNCCCNRFLKKLTSNYRLLPWYWNAKKFFIF